MTYVETFGGELIFPSQTSYLAITTSVDVTLQWPIEQQIAGIDVVADFMDIIASIGGLNIDMPDARQASTGQKVLFNNPGANTYTVRDDTGGTIQTVAIGEQWVFVLTDNTTQAGTWLTFQMGATVSSATAGSLTGAGIKAISTTLNQMIESDVEAGTPFTVVDADRAKCLIYTTGTGTCNLPSPAAVGDDWFFMLRNSGTGTLNIVPPSGVIDDAASISLDPNDSCFIFTDGTDFFTVGLSTGSVIAFDFVSIAIPGSGDFTLSGANLNRIAYRFTGLLTGDRKIVVPGTTQQYWVDNQTTGAFALTIGTSAQVGEPEITQGLSEIFYSDGADVVNAVSAVILSVPVSIAQGGTGATTVGGAQTALGIPLVLNDLNDVTLTAPPTDGILIKSAGDWIDTDQIEVDIAGGENRFRILGTLALTINNFGVEYSILKDAFHFFQLNNLNAGWQVTVGSAASAGTVFYRQLSGAGAFEATWMEMRRFGEVALFEDDVEVFRTLNAGLGGAEANNTLTGAGFERVLTVGDGPFVSDVEASDTNLPDATPITVLSVAVEANASYAVDFYLEIICNATDNFRFTVNDPGGASWNANGLVIASTEASPLNMDNISFIMNITGAASVIGISGSMNLVTDGNAGALTLDASKQADAGADGTFRLGSWMRVQKLD